MELLRSDVGLATAGFVHVWARLGGVGPTDVSTGGGGARHSLDRSSSSEVSIPGAAAHRTELSLASRKGLVLSPECPTPTSPSSSRSSPSFTPRPTLAERRATVEPVSSASYARLALEEVMYQVYKLEALELPYNKGLNALLDSPDVTQIVGRSRMNAAHLIRKIGNAAAHYGQRVSPAEARTAVKYLFDVCRWFALTYAVAEPVLPEGFDESRIEEVGEAARKRSEQEAEAERAGEAMLSRIEALEAERGFSCRQNC